MKALKLTVIASLLAFATAHAAGDEMPVETIVVTAKRPAFIEPSQRILIVTVTAQAPAQPRVVPDVITVTFEDSAALETPQTKPVIETPAFEQPKLTITPPRIELVLADAADTQG